MKKKNKILLGTLVGVLLLAVAIIGFMYKTGRLFSSADTYVNKYIDIKLRTTITYPARPNSPEGLSGASYSLDYTQPHWGLDYRTATDMNPEDGIAWITYFVSGSTTDVLQGKWTISAMNPFLGQYCTNRSKIVYYKDHTTGSDGRGRLDVVLNLNCPDCVKTGNCTSFSPTPTPSRTSTVSPTRTPTRTPTPTPRPTANGVIRLDATWLQNGGSFPSKVYAKWNESSTLGPMNPVEISASNGTANFTGLTIGQYKIYACNAYVGGTCSATNNSGSKNITVVQYGVNNFTLSRTR